jgi:hypothetical protein
MILICTNFIFAFERIREDFTFMRFEMSYLDCNRVVQFYYDEDEFRYPIGSILPACFSRASANLRPGKGFARIGCSPDETCGATRPGSDYEMREDLFL